MPPIELQRAMHEIEEVVADFFTFDTAARYIAYGGFSGRMSWRRVFVVDEAGDVVASVRRVQ